METQARAEVLPLPADDLAILMLELRLNELQAKNCMADLAVMLGESLSQAGPHALLKRQAEREAAGRAETLAEVLAELGRLLCVAPDQVEATLKAAHDKREAAERAEKAATRAERPPKARKSKAPASASEVPMQRLSDRQREMLQGFSVEGNVARFNSDEHQGDWSAVKEVFTVLGGTWRAGGKKQRGGFHFSDDVDAAEAVRLALATGEILDLAGAGFFETPVELAERLVGLAEIQPGERVLEPSAGRGRIALAVRRACPEALIECCELLPENRKALDGLGFDVVASDFLATSPTGLTDVVVGNPPFAKRADVHHIRHAWKFLRPGGRLVEIASVGVMYRDDALGSEFRSFVAAHGRFEELPEGSFIESGTSVRTCLVLLRKDAP